MAFNSETILKITRSNRLRKAPRKKVGVKRLGDNTGRWDVFCRLVQAAASAYRIHYSVQGPNDRPPGAAGAAHRSSGLHIARLEAWPADPITCPARRTLTPWRRWGRGRLKETGA